MTDRALPTGTLTFLFTDLEGSTRLLHDLGASYGELLETHRRLIRDAVYAHGGIEFGTGGDAIYVVFDSAADSVAAAGAAQLALAAQEWPGGVSVRVRMALHTGEAQIVDDDYVGVALHVVARLCAAGHGGQVLISESTRALARQTSVVSLGTHRLRDVPEPMEVFQLEADGLDAEFPPLRTLSAAPNNLPTATDQTIGREVDIVEVAEALVDHRLVTLTGAGGAGKTRLAVEVATAVVAEFADGVWLIQLGAATTPDQVTELTAHELKVGERARESLDARVQRHLATREVLIVFDNCEHLVDPVASFVDTLLANCPGVRVLATSRERLGVRGEKTIAVAPLSVGDRDRPGDAIALFVERASSVVPGFEIAGNDLAIVADICRRLDGLPLAIELAAAQVRGMSLTQLSDRLDQGFRILTSGLRTGAERQRTLDAVVSWSYDLLDEIERSVFRRVSVFADSFTADGAIAVAAWGTVDPADVFDVVVRLADKSLVVPLRGDGMYRYQLLETLRTYGREKSAQAGEHDETVSHLYGWARTLTERLELDMRTSGQDASLHAAALERENLRAVYEQARADGDLELALRIVTFAPTMPSRERRVAISTLLPALDILSPRLHGHALTACAQLSFGMGMSEDGIDAARSAAELFEHLGDARHAAWARYFEAFSSWGFASDDTVRALAANLLDEFRRLDEPLGLAYVLWVSSQLDLDVESAGARATESEALFREISSPFGLAHALEGKALVSLRRNDTVGAATSLRESLELFSDPADQGCTAHVIEAIASLLLQRDLRADGALLLGAAEALRRASGEAHRPWELRSRNHAEELLGDADIVGARHDGRALDFDAAIARAANMLDRAAASA
ncbi:MAG: hypothetical protein QOC79_2392 [Actinomycetota bacterium]|nr:hypothetical protein [Actinomycetota bacterium]